MPTNYQAGKLIDHYKILRVLGTGIASRVYLAQDVNNQQTVVLKFPIDDVVGGAAIYARYRCEGEIGKLLNHPSIQCHLQPGERRQEEYLVLEYLPGRTLREFMQARASQPLAPDEAVRLLLPICEALVYAHAHGVIHRDIKPENILLLDDGSVKLIDFGIALLKTPRRRFHFSMLATPIGTPSYMSPERLRGQPGDAHADIYALGMVLYELLSGRLPFEAHDDGFALVNEQVSHDPPSILQWNAELSPALATVVMRAIRRDANKRYTTMQDLLYDLRHLDAVTPIDYIPDPPVAGGRYRQLILIGCIILAFILLIVAFGLFTQLVHHR